jgi:hypothetical protein
MFFYKLLFCRKVGYRIDRLTIQANLKVQRCNLMRSGSHVRDRLAARHILPFSHQKFAIVRVRGKQIVAVFDDD